MYRIEKFTMDVVQQMNPVCGRLFQNQDGLFHLRLMGSITKSPPLESVQSYHVGKMNMSPEFD